MKPEISYKQPKTLDNEGFEVLKSHDFGERLAGRCSCEFSIHIVDMNGVNPKVGDIHAFNIGGKYLNAKCVDFTNEIYRFKGV